MVTRWSMTAKCQSQPEPPQAEPAGGVGTGGHARGCSAAPRNDDVGLSAPVRERARDTLWVTKESWRAVRPCDTVCVPGDERRRLRARRLALALRPRVSVVGRVFSVMTYVEVVSRPLLRQVRGIRHVCLSFREVCDATCECHGLTQSKQNHFEQARCRILCSDFKLRHSSRSTKVSP